MIGAFLETLEKGRVYTHIVVTLLCWLLTVAAVLIDLWDGIYTARRTHERLRSHKFRRTVRKAGEYWRVLLFGFVGDTLGVLFPWYSLPYATMLLTACLVIVEARSVVEHFRRRKSELAKLPGLLEEIVGCLTEKDAKRLVGRIRDELGLDGEKKKDKDSNKG